MDGTFDEYLNLNTLNENLKSDERTLCLAIENLKQMESLLIEKEKEFCSTDHEQRFDRSMGGRDMLSKRCVTLINHLVHYKCVVEVLAGDLMSLSNEILDDDEFIRLSLIFREAELNVLNAIKVNQQRNVIFNNMNNEVATWRLSGIEDKWKAEHDERRKLINRLLLDQNQIIIEKMTKNLEEQQKLLNQRYGTINTLIKKVLNHHSTADPLYHK